MCYYKKTKPNHKLQAVKKITKYRPIQLKFDTCQPACTKTHTQTSLILDVSSKLTL